MGGFGDFHRVLYEVFTNPFGVVEKGAVGEPPRALIDGAFFFGAWKKKVRQGTLPENNIAPENGWLEYYPFLLGQKAYFQVLC